MTRVGSVHSYASLETSAEEARRSFACAFSSSDEFEAALIKNRRDAGLYGPSARQRQSAFGIAAGIALLVAICVIVL